MRADLFASARTLFFPQDGAGSAEATTPELYRPIDEDTQFASWLPYIGYLPDEQVFVNRDSLGFCLEVLPQSGADERMVDILLSIYAACPTGTGIQYHLLGSPQIKSMLKRYASLRMEDPDAADKAIPWGRPARNDNLYRALARRRVAHLLEGSRQSLTRGFHYTVRDFRLLIAVNVPGHIDDLTRRDELLSLRESMGTTLKAAGFPNRASDAAAVITWCADLTNPHRLWQDNPPISYDDGREIRGQIVDLDTVQTPTPTGLRFSKPGRDDTVEARFYSVNRFPEEFGLWQMSGLIGDLMQGALAYPCPFLITLGVHILDPESTKTRVIANQARATQNADSKMARVMPDIPQKKKDWDAAAQTIDAGGRLVSQYHAVALFSEPNKAIAAEQSARAIWRGRGFELNNDTYLHRQSLLASLPMTLSRPFHADLKRLRRVTTKTAANAIHQAPLIAEWRGTDTPVLLLAGRRGQVMGLDLFDNANRNAAVAGRTRSGKSFFLNDLAMSYAATGAKVWIIDIGRSYEYAVKRAGGTYLEFAPDSPLVFNPFSTVENINEDIKLLLPLHEVMASPRRSLEEVQRKLLNRGILKVWAENGRQATVTHVAELLATGRIDPDDTPDSRAKDLATMLWPWTKHGQHAHWVEGKANISFDADLTVLELEELKNDKDLQQAVMLMVMHRILHEMYRSRSRRKVMITDEAWDLFAGDASKAFIEEGYRRVAKYNGAFVSATQGVNDYFANDSAKAAFTNSGWLFLLNQSKESLEELERSGRLSMNDSMKRLLGSLHTEPGAYSEIYIRSDEGEGVARHLVDPATHLLFSSRPEDRNALDAKLARGLSIDEAISELLQERGIAS